jgi:hypothetical protein
MNMHKLTKGIAALVIIAAVAYAAVAVAATKPAPKVAPKPVAAFKAPTKKVTVEIAGKKVTGTVTQLSGKAAGSKNTWAVQIPGKPTLYVKNTEAGSKGALQKAAKCALGTYCNGSCKNVTVAAAATAAKKPAAAPGGNAPSYTTTQPTDGGGGGGSSTTRTFNDGNDDDNNDNAINMIPTIDRDGDGIPESFGVYGPIDLQMSINPSIVNEGGKCTISYDITNAVNCVMTNGNIFNETLFDGNDGSKRSGDKVVDPGSYTIACVNDDQKVHKQTRTCAESLDTKEF